MGFGRAVKNKEINKKQMATLIDAGRLALKEDVTADLCPHLKLFLGEGGR